MIKLIGFSALAFGFIEWIYDFKMNGWSFATVLSFVYLVERLHHNHHTRVMLKIIGEKVGVSWESSLQRNGLKVPRLFFEKPYSFLRTAMKHQKRRKRKMNLQNINYATLIPTLLAASKIVLQGFGIDIPDEHINLAVNVLAGLGTLIGVYLPHTKAAVVSEAYVKIVPEIKTTYQEMFPKVKEVHAGLKKLYEDIQKNDGSQSFIDASQVYDKLNDIFLSIKPPEPVPEIVEQVPA